MQDKLDQDILLLKLAKILNKAYVLSKEITGIDHVYMGTSGVSIDVKPSVGKNSTLCFLAGEDAWDKDQAFCKVNDAVSICFKIEPPPAKPTPIEEVVEVKEDNALDAA